MNEITAAIKKKAEQYVKDSTIDERNLTKSEYDAIINDYTCGGEDATQRDIDFFVDLILNHHDLEVLKQNVKEVGRYYLIEKLTRYMEDNKL